MKKSVLWLLTVLLTITMFSGCGNTANSTASIVPADSSSTSSSGNADNNTQAVPSKEESDINISFWNNFTAADGEVLKDVVDNFNNTNGKGITITMDVMPENNLTDKLPLSIASNTAPDFFAVGDAFFASFVENKTIIDLSPFFNYEGVNKDDIKEGALAITQVNGTQYLLPMTVTGMYLYWNKDLFTAAGLDPETPPKTWEEVEQMAEAIAAINDDIYGVAFPVRPQFAYNAFNNWALAYGGEVLSNDKSESVLDSPENLEVLKRVQALVRDKKAAPEAPTGPDANDLMLAGRLGMHLNGPWGNGGLRNNKINYGITVLPHAYGKEPVAYAGGVGFAIPTTTDISRHGAIFEFFKYWYNTDVHAAWTNDCIAIPFVISTTEEDEIKNNPVLSIMASQVDYARPFLPGNSNSVNIVMEILGPMLEAVQLGDDPSTALKSADKELKSIL